MNEPAYAGSALRAKTGASGFVLWRLSDDGPSASRIVAKGRHPKPFT
jgi:hypothetical protein